MRIQFLKSIISIFLSCCIIGSALPIKIYAKEAVDAGWTRQKYEYNDAEYMYDSSVNMEYVTMLGMEDEACQERINSYIQQRALDDMFELLLFSVRGTYYEENELGEVRTDVGIKHIDYFRHCYLYGDILSISHSCSDRTVGLFSEFGTWEASKNHSFLEIDNFNMKTNKLVKLNDFFVINEEFWEILEGVDVTLYKDKSQAPIYDELYQCLYNDLISELKEYPGSLEYCKWFLDAQGCLQFYNEYAESWSTFRVPLTLFKNVVQPEYQDYAKGILQGYDFTPTIEERKMDLSPNAASISNAKEEPVFVHRTYQYEDDVELDYFQVTGMQNVSRQREINDYLLQFVLDGAIEDISHIYLNNGYYEEGSNAYYWESMIHVNSVIPDHYLNGQILSFTQTEEVTRKAYITNDGVKKEEISKGPY